MDPGGGEWGGGDGISRVRCTFIIRCLVTPSRAPSVELVCLRGEGRNFSIISHCHALVQKLLMEGRRAEKVGEMNSESQCISNQCL